MPRKTRFQTPGIPQLVRQRGHNGASICKDHADFQTLYGCLAEAAAEHNCKIHAYALLRRDFYLLVTPMESGGVSRTMQAVGRQYVPWFNAMHGRSGALWEGRYRACVIEPDRHVLDCYRFIEQQDEHLGFRGVIGGNRWSSARAHTRGCCDSLVTDHPVYQLLGATPADRTQGYGRICESPLPERACREIDQALSRSLAYASESYKDWIEGTLDYRVRLRKPGRPRTRGLQFTEELVPNVA